MNSKSCKNNAVIGVGSNIDPEINIRHARKFVAREHRLIAESRFTQTEPIGYVEQPPFINGVWLIQTDMKKKDLLQWLHDLEHRLGRIRTEDKNSPRTIDLDLVVWNNRIVDPDVYSRDFLKRGIIEVLPGLADQFDSIN